MKKILIISISILLLAGCSFSNKEAKKTSIDQMTVDPLSIAKCDNDAEIHYWDFTNASGDILELKQAGKDKNNFYILCDPAGSGGFVEVYVFKNNKQIFHKDGIFQGKILFDDNNKLNIYKGVQADGDANCCPSSFELTSYKYDPQTNTMNVVETKNYSAQQFKDLGIDKL